MIAEAHTASSESEVAAGHTKKPLDLGTAPHPLTTTHRHTAGDTMPAAGSFLHSWTEKYGERPENSMKQYIVSQLQAQMVGIIYIWAQNDLCLQKLFYKGDRISCRPY